MSMMRNMKKLHKNSIFCTMKSCQKRRKSYSWPQQDHIILEMNSFFRKSFIFSKRTIKTLFLFVYLLTIKKVLFWKKKRSIMWRIFLTIFAEIRLPILDILSKISGLFFVPISWSSDEVELSLIMKHEFHFLPFCDSGFFVPNLPDSMEQR